MYLDNGRLPLFIFIVGFMSIISLVFFFTTRGLIVWLFFTDIILIFVSLGSMLFITIYQFFQKKYRKGVDNLALIIVLIFLLLCVHNCAKRAVCGRLITDEDMKGYQSFKINK